jgi:hypothetical protein
VRLDDRLQLVPVELDHRPMVHHRRRVIASWR